VEAIGPQRRAEIVNSQTNSVDSIEIAQKKTFNFEVNGAIRRVELSATSTSGWHVLLDGTPIEVNVRLLQPGILSLIIDGKVHRCVLDEGPTETAVEVDGVRIVVALDDPRSLAARRQRRSAVGGEQTIKAPMPGRIVRVLVLPGDEVEAHQAVVAIEAMKMQNELKASRAGKVREIRVEPGQTVAAGETLVIIE
jgi:biotin carboxyl carrier protein